MQHCLLPENHCSTRERGPRAGQLAAQRTAVLNHPISCSWAGITAPAILARIPQLVKAASFYLNLIPPQLEQGPGCPQEEEKPHAGHTVPLSRTLTGTQEAEGSLTPLLQGAEIETLRGGYRGVMWLLPIQLSLVTAQPLRTGLSGGIASSAGHAQS